MSKSFPRIVAFLIVPGLILNSSFLNATLSCPLIISAAKLFSAEALAEPAVQESDPISKKSIRPEVLRDEASEEPMIWINADFLDVLLHELYDPLRMLNLIINELEWKSLSETLKQYSEPLSKVSTFAELSASLKGIVTMLESPAITEIRSTVRAPEAVAGANSEVLRLARLGLAKIPFVLGRARALLKSLQSGNYSGTPEAISVRESIEMVRNAYPDMSITIAPQNDVLNSRAVIDPDHALGIWKNLIQNASFHGNATQLWVQISANATNAIIDFKDNGRGIPAKLISEDRLFEKGVTDGTGTGLGLGIARSIAQAAHGNVLLASPGGRHSGEGAHFRVLLPTDEARHMFEANATEKAA